MIRSRRASIRGIREYLHPNIAPAVNPFQNKPLCTYGSIVHHVSILLLYQDKRSTLYFLLSTLTMIILQINCRH